MPKPLHLQGFNACSRWTSRERNTFFFSSSRIVDPRFIHITRHCMHIFIAVCVLARGQLEKYRRSVDECASGKTSASEGVNSISSLSLPGFGRERSLALSCAWDASAGVSSERRYGRIWNGCRQRSTMPRGCVLQSLLCLTISSAFEWEGRYEVRNGLQS